MPLLTPPAPHSPPLSRAAAEQRLAVLAGWELEEQKGVLHLSKTFTTRHFLEAMELAGRLTALAEAENHHPYLGISWGSLRVTWWTHSLGGLHDNDFLMARATDEIITAYLGARSGS